LISSLRYSAADVFDGAVNMTRLALYLLGPPGVEIDGRDIRIGRRKALALLAYLAVTRQSHTRDALATPSALRWETAGWRPTART
jgi:hypothetical protein